MAAHHASFNKRGDKMARDDRRMFLTMGFGVIGAALLGESNDLILQYIMGEMARLAGELQRSGLRADTLAALARTFRLHVAHAKMTDLDTTLKKATTRTVASIGMEALIDRASSATMMDRHHQTLRAFGLDGLPHDTFSRDAHRAAVIRLQTSGVTPTLQQVVNALGRLSATVAKLTTPLGAARVQGTCQSFRVICNILGPLADALCAVTLVQPEMAPLCAVLQLEQAAACFIASMNGC
jgi:hypothetical protein